MFCSDGLEAGCGDGDGRTGKPPLGDDDGCAERGNWVGGLGLARTASMALGGAGDLGIIV
jgi:hypothetical protein